MKALNLSGVTTEFSTKLPPKKSILAIINRSRFTYFTCFWFENKDYIES